MDDARLLQAERQAKECAARLQDLTSALSIAVTEFEVADAVVTHTAAALGAEGGVLARVADSGAYLETMQAVGYPPDLVARGDRIPLDARHPTAEAVRARGPVTVESRAACAGRFPDLLPVLEAAGHAAAVAVPLLAGSRTLASLCLTFSRAADAGRDVEACLMTLGRLCAQALERSRLFDRERRARERADAAGRRASLLAEASRALCSSLEYEATLRNVAQLAVPYLADWCTVDVLDPTGLIREVALEHADPGRAEWGRAIRGRQAPNLDSPGGLGRVLRLATTELVPEVTDEMLVASATSLEHLELLRAVGIRSWLCVPMVARGRTLGAITFVRTTESDARYGEEDVALAEELARRAASAIDNAQLYERAVSANQSKTNFLTAMSHELRTPLAAVLGYTELLHDGIVGPVTPAQREHLERIRANSSHLLAIIEEILDFAQLEAGTKSVRPVVVRAGDVVREAFRLVEPTVRGKGLECTIQVHEDDPPIETDPTQLRRILVGLLSNAIKFTERGGIRVKVEHPEGSALVTVSDTGVGIPSEHQERIFESFWQVEQSTTRTTGGTGIGLSIARQIAQLLGGDISVESAVGRGSTFTLRLPRTGPPDRAP